MEKPQYLVIGILAVAIGFFALRFTSDEPDDYGSPYDGGDQYAMANGDDFEEGSYGPSGRFGRGGDRAGGGRELGAGGGRTSRFGPAGGSRGGTAGRGGAESVSAGSRERGGRIGSGSGRGGLRVAQEVGRARSGSISNTIHRDRPSMGSGSQADRVEMLTGRDAGIDPFYEEGNGLDDNPDDDVVLEVADKEDVDRKADVLEGVEEGDEAGWIDFTEDSVTTFPNLGNANPNAGTITLDIKPNWNGADVTDNSLLQIREPNQWENRMQLVKNGQFLRFIVTDDTGHEADISFKINEWVEGDAHNVTATWEPAGEDGQGGGQTTLYVDGKQVGTNRFPGKLVFKHTTPMHLGSDYTNGGSYSGANGQFRNFKVLGEAKGPDQLG
jgi:hypothetical protein